MRRRFFLSLFVLVLFLLSTIGPAQAELSAMTGQQDASQDILPNRVSEKRASVAMVPGPDVKLDLLSNPLIGEEFQFRATFENIEADVGFGPFIQIMFPASGVDGSGSDSPSVSPGAPCDGIEFVSATFLNSPVEMEFSPTDCPISGAGATVSVNNPTPLTGSVQTIAGNQILTLILPFGSFPADQPPVDVIVKAKVSNLADTDTPLKITARSGFLFGDDAEGGTPIFDDTDTDSLNWGTALNLNIGGGFKFNKYYRWHESETATGPNHPKSYELRIDVPTGQEIENLIITDTIPNNMVFTGVSSTFPAGAIVTSSLPSSPPTPGGEVVIDFSSLGTVTGGSSSTDVRVFLDFYIPERDVDNNLIIDRNTCANAQSINNAQAQATWDPDDPRDEFGIATGTASHTLHDKCLAIQKWVGIATDTNHAGYTPGDTLKYTLNFQVSDFFGIDNIVVEDFLSDGQTFVPGSATLQVSDQHGTVTEDTFPDENVTLGDKCSNLNTRTPIKFDVSPAMLTIGHPNSFLTGGHAAASPTSSAATGQITFLATIDDEYSCPPVAGNLNIDEFDTLRNDTTISGDVQAITGGGAPPTSGVSTTDSSARWLRIADGELEKQIYAVDGDMNLAEPILLQPEGDMTFRLTYRLPSGDAEDLFIEDFLPLPILDVDDLGVTNWVFDNTPSNSPPLVGTIRPMVGSGGGTPTTCDGYDGLYANSDSNSICLYYGDLVNPANTETVIDLLFTIEMNATPYADLLKMTNTGRECDKNTSGAQDCDLDIAEFFTSEPVLRLNRKGIVATDNPNGLFSPSLTNQVPFTAPGSSCPRFTAPMTSADLSPAINSNLFDVDANDLVTYGIIVENTGSGKAYEVKIADMLPAEVDFVPGTLCVHDGTGAALPFTGDLFGSGIELTNLLDGGKDRSGNTVTTGENLVVITYDAVLDSSIQPGTYQNEAKILHYSGALGGEDYVSAGVGGPYSDVAQVTARPKAIKSIVSTSEEHTTGSDLAIGEIIRYRLQVQIPEGVLSATRLIDTLPSGLTMLDGTAKIAFVSNGAGISSSSATLSSLVNVNGNESSISSITPNSDVPVANITSGPTSYTFDLGNLTNNDDDDDLEYAIIEFNALVSNTTANNMNNSKRNSLSIQVNGSTVATAFSDAKIVEPNVSLRKEVLNVPTGAHETAVYQVTLSNVGNATAFDLNVADILPTGLISLTVRPVISPTGTIITDSSTASDLNLVIDSLDSGQSIVIKYQTKLLADTQCDDITNKVALTYTSLPGPNGTISNATGSSTPGASGAADGERDGSRSGPNDYYKESSANFCPDLSITKSHLGDFIPGQNAIYSLAVTNVGSGPTTGEIVVTDTLPIGLTYVSSSGAGWSGSLWSCNTSGQELVCTHPGPINPDKTSVLNIQVGVSTTTSIQNCAEVFTSADNKPANNQSCDQTNICLPGEEPTLILDPVISTMAISETVTVEVRLQQVTDTRSIQLELGFDPNKVEVVDADAGRDGIQIESGTCPQSDIVLINEADNATGVIRYLASSTYSSCYGDGIVAKITFRALQGGMSSLTFSDWGLSTSKGKHIDLTCTQGMPLHVIAKGAMKGTVNVFGSVLDPEGVNVTLMNSQGTQVGTMTTAADGAYQFNDLPVGAYTLKVEKDTFLYALRTVLIEDGQINVVSARGRAIADNTVIVPEIILWPGDGNGDDQVNLADLLPFSQLLNQGHSLLNGIQCANGSSWDPVSEALQMSADFNEDCEVNILDITIYNTTINAFFNGCTDPVGPNVPVQCVDPGSKAKAGFSLP